VRRVARAEPILIAVSRRCGRPAGVMAGAPGFLQVLRADARPGQRLSSLRTFAAIARTPPASRDRRSVFDRDHATRAVSAVSVRKPEGAIRFGGRMAGRSRGEDRR